MLPLVAPIIAVRTLLVHAARCTAPAPPLVYLLGVYAMAVAYGLYYVARRPRYDSAVDLRRRRSASSTSCFLLWQTYWAILTARSSSWGTRPATAGSTAEATA